MPSAQFRSEVTRVIALVWPEPTQNQLTVAFREALATCAMDICHETGVLESWLEFCAETIREFLQEQIEPVYPENVIRVRRRSPEEISRRYIELLALTPLAIEAIKSGMKAPHLVEALEKAIAP